MKFILLVILINLANPSEDATMMHKAFDSLEACELAVGKLPTPPKDYKVSAFCASEADLLELKDA